MKLFAKLALSCCVLLPTSLWAQGEPNLGDLLKGMANLKSQMENINEGGDQTQNQPAAVHTVALPSAASPVPSSRPIHECISDLDSNQSGVAAYKKRKSRAAEETSNDVLKAAELDIENICNSLIRKEGYALNEQFAPRRNSPRLDSYAELDYSNNCLVTTPDMGSAVVKNLNGVGDFQANKAVMESITEKCRGELTAKEVVTYNKRWSQRYLEQTQKAQAAATEQVTKDEATNLYSKFTYNTVELGQSYASFVSNNVGYACKKLNDRASECQPLATKRIEKFTDSWGRQTNQLVERTNDPKIDRIWSFFMNNQMNASKAELKFLDGRLVAIKTLPWNSSRLMQPLLDKYGKPAEFMKRKYLFMSWEAKSNGMAVKMALTDEPSNPFFMLYDVVKSDEFYSTLAK